MSFEYFIKEARAKYDSYNEEWIRAYFDEKSGGFNVYHKDHKFSKTGGGGEAEKKVGELLAKYNSKQIEFLPENDKSPDIKFDNQTWDIKYINNANEETVRKYIADAAKADNAIFYYEKITQYQVLRSAIIRETGKYLKRGKISELPDIYHIKDGLLKVLWKKN
ncbi:MAG: hypothetical protein LBE91_03110 [Tannerella sp.]|jgi:hypothetical protein|nr:hypothetical protein [Tannerella sp.]